MERDDLEARLLQVICYCFAILWLRVCARLQVTTAGRPINNINMTVPNVGEMFATG